MPFPIILLCDDEYLIRSVGKKLLSACGFEAITVGSGTEVLHEVLKKGKPFKAIILDMEMPEMSGLEVYAELERQNIRVPVVLSTGHVDEEHLEAARSAGISHVLEKPYTLKDLRMTLHDIGCV